MTSYIGVDIHARQQTVSFLDTGDGTTGQVVLEHERDDIKGFYGQFQGEVIIGIEACGYTNWFEELMEQLGHQLLVGDAAEIRRLARRRQKNDRRDADLLLDLLVHDEFPSLFRYSKESREVLRQLRYRHKLVKLRTMVVNSLHALAINAGLSLRAQLLTRGGRLSLTHTLLSKRKLLKLVEEGHVEGWDDPRMPTLSGMRRRGYTSTAIRNFCASTGVSKTNGITQLQQLEYFLRQNLNQIVPRVMCVQKPLRVVIENYPDDLVEEMDAINNPEDSSAGTRKIPFSKTLYIEEDDFREDPPKQFYRLAPGREVRLRYAYLITCKEVIKDSSGRIVELRCTFDPATRGGNTPDGRKVKSTIHWVSAAHALPAEVRLYDNLFLKEDPNEVEEGHDFTANLNPDSLQVLHDCKIEPSVRDAERGTKYQFERLGYYCVDRGTEHKLVFKSDHWPARYIGKDRKTRNDQRMIMLATYWITMLFRLYGCLLLQNFTNNLWSFYPTSF